MKTIDNKKTIRTSKNILRTILAVLICTVIFACSDDDDAPAGVIDLSAEDMTFELIEDNGNFGGVAEIIGTVKNVGTRDYDSRPGAQSIQIRRRDAGFTSSTVLMTEDFVSLGVEEELIIKTQINWNVATPEFKPEFILVINYDPDNLIDGLPDNDDKNFDNNTLTKPGEDIDELFLN